MTIGYLADRGGIGLALGSTSVFFVLGTLMIAWIPETRGNALK